MEMVKIVAFTLGEEEYAFDIEHVQSIERMQHITRVPNAPTFVKGVINLRGHVTPIIDLRSLLTIEQAGYTDNTRIIMTKLDEIELGLIVDQTKDVMDVKSEDFEAPSSCGFDSEYIGGIANIQGRLIILLKLAELMEASVDDPQQVG
jgi:purine-binding chemotaxis protein CheW